MTPVSAVMSSERFLRNHKLVVSDLGGTGFAVYVPPEPKPLRLPASAWLAIDSLAETELTHSQLRQQLNLIPPGHETFEHYLQWLVSKRILIRVQQPEEGSSLQSRASSHQKVNRKTGQAGQSGDASESNSIHLFTLEPRWPAPVQVTLLRLLRLQIWMAGPMLLIVLAYLAFFLLAPAPSALHLSGASAAVSTRVDVLGRVLIGLLGVNLLSTALTWLAQSVTGLGDGKVLLRLLFGFIPRLGVNPYKGPAMEANKWTPETGDALLCVSQPLLTRLGLASILIVLMASDRLQAGLAGAQLYSLANIVLHICLFTGLLLALPFRVSPGYRIMILLTDLPPNMLSQSVRHLYIVVDALIRWLLYRNRASRDALKTSIKSWRDIAFLAFALCFIALITAKVLVVLFVAIPRLAAGLPELLGGASKFVFTLILLVLLIRFIGISTVPKLAKLSKKRSKPVGSKMSNDELLPSLTASPSEKNQSRSRIIMAWLLLVVGLILVIPIDRAVTGSVVVSTARDLTVRAPADVRITKIFQSGPSTQVIPAGTPLIRLQSQQLDHDLNQSISELEKLRSELNTLTEERQSNTAILREIRSSLKISQQADQVLENQLKASQALIQQGAFSQKMADEILLRSYELQGNEQQKIQQILELQAAIRNLELRIKSTQQAINQSLTWKQSLLQEKQKLNVQMPFDGLITSSTSGLMLSFVSKGEPILELKEGSLNIVNVLMPDHDRSLVRVNQRAEVRLYAQPDQPLSAVVQSIRPSSELINEKVYFQASLRLSEPLTPQLLQSSGAARIKTGQTNLLMIVRDSLGRFIRIDVWSWTP